MGNTIQTFTNDAFGAIRTITLGGQMLFCGKDVAIALGYANPSKALQDHCKGFHFVTPLRPLAESSRSASLPKATSTASSSPPNSR